MKDFLFHVKHSPTGESKNKKTYGVVAVKIIGEQVWFVLVDEKNQFSKAFMGVCTFEGFGKREELHILQKQHAERELGKKMKKEK